MTFRFYSRKLLWFINWHLSFRVKFYLLKFIKCCPKMVIYRIYSYSFSLLSRKLKYCGNYLNWLLIFYEYEGIKVCPIFVGPMPCQFKIYKKSFWFIHFEWQNQVNFVPLVKNSTTHLTLVQINRKSEKQVKVLVILPSYLLLNIIISLRMNEHLFNRYTPSR